MPFDRSAACLLLCVTHRFVIPATSEIFCRVVLCLHIWHRLLDIITTASTIATTTITTSIIMYKIRYIATGNNYYDTDIRQRYGTFSHYVNEYVAFNKFPELLIHLAQLRIVTE